jgi:hypothetical protein
MNRFPEKRDYYRISGVSFQLAIAAMIWQASCITPGLAASRTVSVKRKPRFVLRRNAGRVQSKVANDDTVLKSEIQCLARSLESILS